MIGGQKELIGPGEIASKIAQLVPSESTETPVDDQIWRFPPDGSLQNGFRFNVAFKRNGNRPGFYRLTLEAFEGTLDSVEIRQTFFGFQRSLGDLSGLFQLPSGSPKIGYAFWDANQVTQKQTLVKRMELETKFLAMILLT